MLGKPWPVLMEVKSCWASGRSVPAILAQVGTLNRTARSRFRLDRLMLRPSASECPIALARLQPPNNAKAAISIIKTVLTTARARYTSRGEDGSNFIGQPRVRCRENHFRKHNLRLTQ